MTYTILAAGALAMSAYAIFPALWPLPVVVGLAIAAYALKPEVDRLANYLATLFEEENTDD